MNRLIAFYRKCNQSKFGSDLMCIARYLYSRDPFRRKLKIINHGSLRIQSKAVEGSGNILEIGENSFLNKINIKIIGSYNKIIIGKNCNVGKHCRFYLFGNNLELRIDDECNFTHDDELLVQEDGRKITIGKDCLFSHHINVRTSDAHSIFNESGQRINYGADVTIGNHVWITPHCVIQKGTSIGEGSIIATNSIVTKDVPAHCIAAGMPAKVVKENISWLNDLINDG